LPPPPPPPKTQKRWFFKALRALKNHLFGEWRSIFDLLIIAAGVQLAKV
jgi:hypothetical protein